MTTIKYSENAKCKCGGELAYDATYRERLPLAASAVCVAVCWWKWRTE